MLLADTSVRDLLDAFSSTDPTPGGGSAAALASAVGASLLMMVAGLPKTRGGTDGDRAALASAAAALAGIRRQLTAAIDADTDAYNQVVGAYKLPKGSAEEQTARKSAIQSALRATSRSTSCALGARAHGNTRRCTATAPRPRQRAVALLRAGLRGRG
jgi:formiminotetrahydrofolate cyclodeaminase